MTSDHGGGSITSVLNETRVFPPPRRVCQPGPHRQPRPVRGAVEPGQGRPRGLLGRAGRGIRSGTSPGTRCSTGSRRSPSGSSAASSTRHTTASTATAPAPTRTRPRSSGRASRAIAACCAIRTCSARCREFANVLKGLGVRKGDVVAIYMPMIPELVDRAAGLCPDRGAAHGDLRRLQRRGARGTDPGLQGEGARDRRRRLSPRQDRSAQGERRRRGGALPDARESSSSTADRPRQSRWHRAATTGGTS